MAQIVGGICTSHIPAIGNAIARELEDDPYWRPFFGGYPRAREWLADVKPDVAVMIYNDHGLNFFLDKMPTFAIGAAAEYRNADEGWGLPTRAAVSRRPEALVAHHRVGDGGRVRRHDVPGDARRSRVHRAAAAALARTRPPRRAHRARGAQHDPTSAALAHALLQARPCARPRDRVVSRGRARRADRDGRHVAPARRRARGLHQQGIRPALPREDRRRARGAREATRFTTSCGSRARKASS